MERLPLDLKLLMNQATNVVVSGTTTVTTPKTYKLETGNATYSDKMYYDQHKQGHHKDYPIVQIVMNPSATQVINQPTPATAHQGGSQIVIQDDQLVAYKRAYGVDTQQLFTLAPVTQYQVIAANNRTGAIPLSQAGQNQMNIPTFPTPTYVVATPDGQQIHTLPESIIQHEPNIQLQPQQQQITSQEQHHHPQTNEQEDPLAQQLQQQHSQDQLQQLQQQQHQQQIVHVSNNTSRANRGIVVSLKERPFKCDQCTASFIDSFELDEHKKKHTGDGPFTCEDCHFTFMYKSHFKSHKTRCLKRRAKMPSLPKPIINPSPVKRQFPINNPHHQLTHKQNQNAQNQHAQQTTQYQPIQVSQVISKANGPSLNQRGNNVVVRQISKQSGQSKFNPSNPSFKRIKKETRVDRPYECDECDASFQNEVDLKSHRMKHTGEGPFKCEECRFVFLYRKLYDAHRRRCEKRRKEVGGSCSANVEIDSNTSLQLPTSTVNSLVMAPQSQIHQLQPQHQEIHIQPAPTMATAVPVSLPTSMLSNNIQMHNINVSGQPQILEMRPNNSQAQDIHSQIQLSHNPVIEQVIVSPGLQGLTTGGRQDIKYEVIPVTPGSLGGLVDVPEGVNVSQIMNLIKVKGPNQ